jgi:hypothetical protein
MNDIAKKSISEKFTKALQTEKMQVKDAAIIIGIMPTYASMMKNEALWGKCPIPVWDKALAWVNSGQTLRKYAEKHGHVLPVTPAPGVKELTPEEKALLGVPFKMDEEPGIEMTLEERMAPRTKLTPEEIGSLKGPIKKDKKTDLDFIQPIDPDPTLQRTETARLKVCLDIEINLVINGQKVQVK